MSYVKFKRWEREIYLKGYQDAKDNKDPIYPLKIKGRIPKGFAIPVFNDLALIDLLGQNPEGLTTEDIWQRLGISKGTFYLHIKSFLLQNIVIKDTTRRPRLFKLAPKKESATV